MAAPIAFVVPVASARISGGDRVNAELLTALGERAHRIAPDELAGLGDATDVVLDTLCLEALDRLPAGRRVWLLAHLLPSQDPAADGAKRARENAALSRLHGAIALSDFMQRALRERGVAGPIAVLEPGVPSWARPVKGLRKDDGPTRVLLVGNLSPVKGVRELLAALAAARAPDDRFALRVIGDDADAGYAAECRALAASPALRDAVELVGGRPHAALAAEYRAADIVMSAGFESYGLALAEARACGVPLVVLDRGHAAAHLTGWNGVVAADHAALAAALLAIVRAPARLAELRMAAYRLAATQPRPSWADAAATLLAALEAAR